MTYKDKLWYFTLDALALRGGAMVLESPEIQEKLLSIQIYYMQVVIKTNVWVIRSLSLTESDVCHQNNDVASQSLTVSFKPQTVI